MDSVFNKFLSPEFKSKWNKTSFPLFERFALNFRQILLFMAFDTSPNGNVIGANDAGGFWHSGAVGLPVNEDIWLIYSLTLFSMHITCIFFSFSLSVLLCGLSIHHIWWVKHLYLKHLLNRFLFLFEGWNGTTIPWHMKSEKKPSQFPKYLFQRYCNLFEFNYFCNCKLDTQRGDSAFFKLLFYSIIN